jgi:uncharacterized protein
MTHTNVLIVVAKRPTPGQTKTRLTPALDPEQAAALFECFLLDTLALMRRVANVKVEIAYLPEHERAYFARLAPDFGLHLQQGADLGARLDEALQHYLAAGASSVVIMDSDSPSLPAVCLAQAFTALENGADVVLGPCDDGGYYLIGLKRPAPRLLREVHMSTPTVAQETLALAAAEGLKVNLLPTWYDVDEIASLERLADELETSSPQIAPNTRAFLSRPEIRSRLHPKERNGTTDSHG